jgi:hypothetical protein
MQVYSDDENRQVDDAVALFADVPAHLWKVLKLADWKVAGKMAVTEGSKLAKVQGTTVVDAGLWNCSAYNVQVLSRAQVKGHKDFSGGGGGGQELNATELNGHSFVYQMTIDHKIPGFALREYVSLCVWRKESEEVRQPPNDSYGRPLT